MTEVYKVRKGIFYFPDFYAARDFAAENVKGFPSWRVVEYEPGHAIQLYESGGYFGTPEQMAKDAEASQWVRDNMGIDFRDEATKKAQIEV